MSTTLLFLVPIGMLAIAWSFCFIGCVFQTGGLANPYSNIILAEQGLIAYWPLGDKTGPTAVDLTGHHHDGTYTNPPDYPAVPANSRPLTSPTVNLGQGSIVPGDVSGNGIVDQNLFPGSADFEGGYVSIPWPQNSPDLSQFTLEFWIKPGWNDAKFIATVFSAATSITGFAVEINEKNLLQVAVGTGAGLTVVPQNPTVAIDTTKITYVAVTCDASGTIKLWINPQDTSDSNTPPPPMPNQIIPNPGYAAIGQSQQATFFIGVGDNQDAQTLRTQPMGAGAPLFPVKGLIQAVALYNIAVDPSRLQTHFTIGSGA